MKFKITPVELHNGIWFKREDKFKLGIANGGKLRQVLALLNKNKELAKKGVMTSCSLHSPQSIIVAEACKKLKLPCYIAFGGNDKSIAIHKYPTLASKIATTEVIAKTGRHSVLYNRLKLRQKEKGGFIVKYGMDLEDNRDCFITSVAEQVVNIPKNTDTLTMVCGSGITATGVLVGLSMYGINIKEINLVGVAPNRVSKIKRNLEVMEKLYGLKDLSKVKFNYIDLYNKEGFQYEKKEYARYDFITFHPNYEAKAFNWFINHIDMSKRNLFWIVGSDINE